MAVTDPEIIIRLTKTLPKALTAGLGFVRHRLAIFIIALIAVMGASTLVAFFVSRDDQAQLRDYIWTTRDIRMLQFALLDTQSGVSGVVLSGSQSTAFATFVRGMSELNAVDAGVFQVVDDHAFHSGGGGQTPHPVTDRVNTLRDAWATAVMLGMDHQQAAAQAVLDKAHTAQVMTELQMIMRSYLGYRSDKVDAEWDRIAEGEALVLLINLLGAMIAIAATSFAFASSRREAKGREAAISASLLARREVETLFGMTEILQSAASSEDAYAVLRATALDLLGDFGGALYVFNNSRDRLDFATEWGPSAADTPPLHIAPDSCWALKRGKPHLNGRGEQALRCAHTDCSSIAFEIPIVARGEIHGLLVLRGDGLRDAETLKRIQPIAIALADAMSLALSNIVLRERLRNQALRDPLTSLYNRRFLEEMLERLTTDAERRRAPVAAIMMDLDHFKNLNDRYGHAAGDLALRDTASVVLASLRPADIACRYGGEELAILLPDTTLDVAMARAEQIRVAISATTSNGITVTASFGVASMPENCSRASELLPTADKALYRAKDEGRDRVVGAPLRPSAEILQLTHAGWNLDGKRAGD
ncbi:GGDEF domain-containing protein [Acidisoma cellulosilytica]|uniref:diguanylate cyclase n=1 Tax=Acidisoma cellulosilyticum TaxID=2802395 RepID=A0A963Z2L5_9PROT|nr:GGDEF domain-containing protein [Acidisoma cellulosilyticum]MCB8881584.1 GGDEF domain-containing protein [Acidisoma cellulosilyticum]